MKKLLFILVFVLVINSVSRADDFYPPPWRDVWSTTRQHWDFPTPAFEDVIPDGPGLLIDDPIGPPYEEPGYLPSTKIILIEPGPGMDWMQGDPVSGRIGIWPLSGRMDFVVDNHDPQNDWKIVWLQIVWRPQEAGASPQLVDLDPLPSIDYPPNVLINQDLGFGWTGTAISWRIPGNPPDEYFSIIGDIDVDQIVIDTWCIPEPTTLLIFSLGGLLLRKRK